MKISPYAKRALARHVNKAWSHLELERYHQEPHYVAALFGRLEGVAFSGRDLRLEFKSTMVNDRGPGSAEFQWGADFAIEATLRARRNLVRKVVLGQAKRGEILTLSPSKQEKFREQSVKMSGLTEAIVGIEIPEHPGVEPKVRILEVSPQWGKEWAAQSAFSDRSYCGKIFAKDDAEPPILVGEALSLTDYFCKEMIVCRHGARDLETLQICSSSHLNRLRLEIEEL